MDIFESLENLNVSEECFDEIMDMVEELLSETSDERAHAASEESHKRYNAARNAYDTTKAMIDRNKKGGFFSAEEIEELKDKLKQQKQELKNAERISVRDNKNQFNRDKRLNKIPEELLSEDILTDIKQKYPESKDVLKRLDLTRKAKKAQREERNEAIKREPMDKDEAAEKVYMKRNLRGKGDENIYRTPLERSKQNLKELTDMWKQDRKEKREKLTNKLKDIWNK